MDWRQKWTRNIFIARNHHQARATNRKEQIENLNRPDNIALGSANDLESIEARDRPFRTCITGLGLFQSQSLIEEHFVNKVLPHILGPSFLYMTSRNMETGQQKRQDKDADSVFKLQTEKSYFSSYELDLHPKSFCHKAVIGTYNRIRGVSIIEMIGQGLKVRNSVSKISHQRYRFGGTLIHQTIACRWESQQIGHNLWILWSQ